MSDAAGLPESSLKNKNLSLILQMKSQSTEMAMIGIIVPVFSIL